MCLKAVMESQRFNTTRAEVILVDDASPDNTLDIVSRIRGLRVLVLERNRGFLRAANAGLQEARGKHVLFLNNDTEPVGRWLDPMVSTLDGKPKALCVGSRLVFPDGALQEAGGIIFNDGSGWNYGRGWDAFDPRVTFERQVDYVSGASLLVDGTFLRYRGGFDDQYAPAYYEDTDLCFAAREAGGEVWYQPESIVVHHEGVSHGTDESAGLKAYQRTNREKFRRRWATTLQGQLGPGVASVPVARQRATGGRVLVIDNEVPTPDRDSGSVRISALMEGMLALGHAVTFLPVNGWRREPYTQRLERKGIEVLGDPASAWPLIQEMAAGISHVWISRPFVAEQMLPRVRQVLPRATVIYDTVDVHFLRLKREAELTGDQSTAHEAERIERQEIDLIQRADVAVVVSPYELQLVEPRTSTAVALVPNVHAEQQVHPLHMGREGIMFVGGFRHPPNEDAVVWFVESVLPHVLARHPEAVFSIVGSGASPRVEGLASDNVVVAGWAPDLTAMYARARVAVAPLRYGAGVKGKVGEALSLGVPMVVTSVAAEGMGIVDREHALIGDSPEEFAMAVCELLEDDELWSSLSLSGRDLMNEEFGSAATLKRLQQVLDPSGKRGEPLWG
jgi:GT2 family glycosyltransferase/glycosyltransferase involved in cell wall biosynthesis